MKRKSVLGALAVMMLLSACAGETQTQQEEKTGQTEQQEEETITIADYQEKNHTDCSTPFAEDSEGYYFYNGDTERLCYYEKNENIIVPLCSKTDCDHSGTDCNAYIGGMSSQTLTLAGDRLYYVAQQGKEAAVFSTAADGTGGVEKAVTLCEVYGDSYGVTDGIFAKGYLYYVENEIDTEQDREYYNLYRIKVESDATPELLYQEKDENCNYNIVCYLKAEGDGIYFSNMVSMEEGYYGQIQRYDTKNGTVEVVFSYEDGNEYNGRYEVIGDDIYLLKVGGTVERYNCESKEKSVFYEDETGVETNCEIEFDGNYFYLDNCVEGFIKLNQRNRTINVRDTEGKLVETIALPGNSEEIYCAFDNGIIYEQLEEGEDGVCDTVYYADKKQIGTGSVTFEKCQPAQ